NIQNLKIYENALDYPLVYVSQDSELWFIPLISAIVFGVTNLTIQAATRENHLGNKLKAFCSAAFVGIVLAVGVWLGLSVPYLAMFIKAVVAIYGAATIGSALSGIVPGLISGDWSKLGNTAKLMTGNFYLDANRN